MKTGDLILTGLVVAAIGTGVWHFRRRIKEQYPQTNLPATTVDVQRQEYIANKIDLIADQKITVVGKPLIQDPAPPLVKPKPKPDNTIVLPPMLTDPEANTKPIFNRNKELLKGLSGAAEMMLL